MISFSLYQLKTWGAGDAKLYFTIVTLIPLNLYVDNSFSVFPGFLLLAMIFSLGFLYLFIETTILFIRDLNKKLINKGFLIIKGFNKQILTELLWNLSFSYFFSSTAYIILTNYCADVFVNNRGLFMFLNVFIISVLLNKLKGKRICLCGYNIISVVPIGKHLHSTRWLYNIYRNDKLTGDLPFCNRPEVYRKIGTIIKRY